MSMFSEIATESNVQMMCEEIERELTENRDKPDAVAALKKVGRFSLTLLEGGIPEWVDKYRLLFR